MYTLHLLTHRLSAANRPLAMSVLTGTFDGDTEIGRAGFLLGVGEGKIDYRSAALVQMAAGPGGGIFACIDRHGRLQIRDNTKEGRPVLGASEGQVPAEVPAGGQTVLSLTLTPDGDATVLSLTGRDAKSTPFLPVSDPRKGLLFHRTQKANSLAPAKALRCGDGAR